MSKRNVVVLVVVAVVAAVVIVVAVVQERGKSEAARPGASAADRPRPAGEAPLPSVATPKSAPGDALAVPDEKPFWRGHPDKPQKFGNADTHPMKPIAVSAFRIARRETTVDAYDRCVAAGACGARGCGDGTALDAIPSLPATCLSWNDATAYCAWVGGRLPTEAEWEKAARGMDGRKYPWGNDEPTCERAVYNQCGMTEPDAVGAHATGRSPYGVEDLAGNVAEWVADWYGPTYYVAAPERDPAGPTSGEQRVLRGGSFMTGSRLLMTGYRSFAAAGERRPDVGFRCVWPGR